MGERSGAWVIGAAAVLAAGAAARGQSAFATRVVEYAPAPGQFVNHPEFNDPSRALGAPEGGPPGAPANGKVVTLGGFGGRITLGFDGPIVNVPATAENPRGVDFIVFGNAFFVGGDPARRWAEMGVIEVSRDENGNGEADDAWYVIGGSHLPARPGEAWSVAWWDDDVADLTLPPEVATWVPAGRSGAWMTAGHALTASIFSPVVLVNAAGAMEEAVWGYADCTPTLALGDVDGDGEVDDPALEAAEFYGRPDDPMEVGITAGSGGGDGIALEWAVDGETGAAVSLEAVDFVRITTGHAGVSVLFGERSVEVGGVARVRVSAADPRDFNGDGVVDPDDLGDFINCYFAPSACARGDFNGDGSVDPDDLGDFINVYFS